MIINYIKYLYNWHRRYGFTYKPTTTEKFLNLTQYYRQVTEQNIWIAAAKKAKTNRFDITAHLRAAPNLEHPYYSYLAELRKFKIIK